MGKGKKFVTERNTDTYKAEMVLEYCEENQTVPSMTLAKMIMRNHPLDFVDLESTRTMVRRLRGELKRRQAGAREHLKRTEEQIQDAQAGKHWHDIPESDYEEPEVFYLPTGYKKIASLSDVHIPYHSVPAIEITVKFLKGFDPDVIYLNGDTIDMYQASDFMKDRRKRDLAGELELTRQFLDYIKAQFPKAKIYYKAGNHDVRWSRYLMKAAPALLGIDEFNLDVILKLGEKGIGYIPDRQFAKMGNLFVLHGHELEKGFGGQVNPARTTFLRAMHDTLIGHHHRTSSHSEKTLDNKIITTYSQGCLCGLKPDYAPQNKYNHGFATIELDSDGSYLLDNYTIRDGKVRQ